MADTKASNRIALPASQGGWLPSSAKPRIYFLTADFWGCGWYRMSVPATALAVRGWDVTVEDELLPAAPDHYDTFVFQRQYLPRIIPIVQTLRAMGKKVIGELDDDFWHLHSDNPVVSFWYGNDKANLRSMEAFLAECDLLTTTTEPLARILRRFNPNVVILPNQLPSDQWSQRHRQRTDGRLVVGWAGGQPHRKDVDLLAGTMEQILDEYPHVEFHVAGMHEYPFKHHERFRMLDPKPIAKYPDLLAGFDIGLAPLVDTTFNRAKSDLKFIEYGMVKVPAVLSKVEPYVRSVKHGKTGFLADNTKDWLKYVRRLIEDESLREDMAEAAHAVAIERTIEKNIGLWEDLYTGG